MSCNVHKVICSVKHNTNIVSVIHNHTARIVLCPITINRIPFIFLASKYFDVAQRYLRTIYIFPTSNVLNRCVRFYGVKVLYIVYVDYMSEHNKDWI